MKRKDDKYINSREKVSKTDLKIETGAIWNINPHISNAKYFNIYGFNGSDYFSRDKIKNPMYKKCV